MERKNLALICEFLKGTINDLHEDMKAKDYSGAESKIDKVYKSFFSCYENLTYFDDSAVRLKKGLVHLMDLYLEIQSNRLKTNGSVGVDRKDVEKKLRVLNR